MTALVLPGPDATDALPATDEEALLSGSLFTVTPVNEVAGWSCGWTTV